ncbi:hypothetical protein [Bordetella avium]|uniref:hypothetical protein n=1 Tax=Bordetella avium TaxID=521 RepID=UPI000E6A6A17|nr:hypothetical protein [Bordetella avium]RIQ63455.1 hypothetical protein D0842_07385 [Bordetella avium]
MNTRKWWQTKPWAERSTAQKAGIVTGWCVLAVLVLAVVSEDEPAETATASPAGPSQTVAAAQAKPEQVAPAAVPEKSSVPEPKKPLDLAEARLFAKGTLRVINEAEQSLNDGIQLGDGAGITKHVWKPLQAELERWPTLVERQPNDQREHFSYCQDAALRLQILSDAVKRERTVETMKYLRKDEAEYRKAKQQCEQQVKATDSQIKAAIAAEDAELKKKFGGRECLTVYGVDQQTGKVIEEPKPAHCKKSTSL